VGFVPPAAIGSYYERASVVCVPSRREGYGMTAREALAYGRPVVATRVGGLRDLDGPGAVLVAPGDVAALRAAVAGLLADGDRRTAAGNAARSRAEAALSVEASAAGLLRVYSEAVASTIEAAN
jgi:glycosyltransferase involved in cell wall biosynthesis